MGSSDCSNSSELIKSLKDAGVMYLAINPDGWLIPSTECIYSIVAKQVLAILNTKIKESVQNIRIFEPTESEISNVILDEGVLCSDWANRLSEVFTQTNDVLEQIIISKKISTLTAQVIKENTRNYNLCLSPPSDALEFLKEASKNFILIATPSVPRELCKMLLEHLDFKKYFNSIRGIEISIFKGFIVENGEDKVQIFYCPKNSSDYWQIALAEVTTETNLHHTAIMDTSSASFQLLDDHENKIGAFITLDPRITSCTSLKIPTGVNCWGLTLDRSFLFKQLH